jgi:hypothetical protein
LASRPLITEWIDWTSEAREFNDGLRDIRGDGANCARCSEGLRGSISSKEDGDDGSKVSLKERRGLRGVATLLGNVSLDGAASRLAARLDEKSPKLIERSPFRIWGLAGKRFEEFSGVGGKSVAGSVENLLLFFCLARRQRRRIRRVGRRTRALDTQIV